jgi:hypothetical protein
MSRHSFETLYQGRPLVVTLGWDSPLGYFHLTLEWLDISDDDDGTSRFLYSNLDDENPFPICIDVYRERLAALGIAIPERMFQEALEDARRNVVNRSVEHRADGRMIEHSKGRPRSDPSAHAEVH